MIHKTILIVEDNLDTRLLYRKALEMEDYQVVLVGSGHEAIEQLKTANLPSLILLDLTLPEMSGAEFLELVRSNSEWAAIKVVIVSGWDNLKTKAKEIGADGCIRKPFELSRLYEEVEKYLPVS